MRWKDDHEWTVLKDMDGMDCDIFRVNIPAFVCRLRKIIETQNLDSQ
jgi:hypothetical protein